MSKNLSKDAVLRELMATLVAGWGYGAVLDTLLTLESGKRSNRASKSDAKEAFVPAAVSMVEASRVPNDKRELLLRFASDYDAERALPKMADARSILASHNADAREIRDRNQAFRRLLPILEKMSEKGLLRLMSRSRHSGPAELDDISDAIRGSGERRRDEAQKP